MSKHPNLTSGPLINGAGIVSILFCLVVYNLNVVTSKENYYINC